MLDERMIREQLQRFDADAPIEEAWMPPASWYVEPAIHRLERTALLRSWQPVMRVADLGRAPGSYASGCILGEPWVIVRGQDGTPRAFHNTCRHKGREVVTGHGTTKELVCGYHAWRYGLDGRLVSAPRIGGIQQFDRDAMSLVPLRMQAWGPWLFVNIDPDAASLDVQCPELSAALDERGFANLAFVSRRSWTIECNWKVYIDNYLDGGYHIPHMHPSLDAQLDMANYQTQVFARSSIQSCPPSSESDDRIDYKAVDRIGPGAIYGWIYPNLMLNRYGPCLDSNYVLPRGVDACEVHYEFYFEPDTAGAREFVEASIAQSDITQHEDIEICESVQRGLHSVAYDRGRYAPRVEVGEYHFHQLLARDLLRLFCAQRSAHS